MAKEVTVDITNTPLRAFDADGNGNGPFTLAATLAVPGSGSAGAAGSAVEKTLSFARTADTNAYAAGDVIGTGTGSAGAVLEFTNIGPAGGVIMLTSSRLLIGLSAVPSGMTNFRLHLYSATPDSALGDNGAWDLTANDRASYLGYLELGTPVDLGSTLFVQADILNHQVKLASGSTSLFGYLRTIAGYTPASGTTYSVSIGAVPL